MIDMIALSPGYSLEDSPATLNIEIGAGNPTHATIAERRSFATLTRLSCCSKKKRSHEHGITFAFQVVAAG
jgi:hypothetical protein